MIREEPISQCAWMIPQAKKEVVREKAVADQWVEETAEEEGLEEIGETAAQDANSEIDQAQPDKAIEAQDVHMETVHFQKDRLVKHRDDNSMIVTNPQDLHFKTEPQEMILTPFQLQHQSRQNTHSQDNSKENAQSHLVPPQESANPSEDKFYYIAF